MTILWSVIPLEVLYASTCDASAVETQEIQMGQARMVISSAPFGMAKVERLISPNPRDYLRPEWQPGALIPYPHQTQS